MTFAAAFSRLSLTDTTSLQLERSSIETLLERGLFHTRSVHEKRSAFLFMLRECAKEHTPQKEIAFSAAYCMLPYCIENVLGLFSERAMRAERESRMDLYKLLTVAADDFSAAGSQSGSISEEEAWHLLQDILVKLNFYSGVLEDDDFCRRVLSDWYKAVGPSARTTLHVVSRFSEYLCKERRQPPEDYVAIRRIFLASLIQEERDFPFATQEPYWFNSLSDDDRIVFIECLKENPTLSPHYISLCLGDDAPPSTIVLAAELISSYSLLDLTIMLRKIEGLGKEAKSTFLLILETAWHDQNHCIYTKDDPYSCRLIEELLVAAAHAGVDTGYTLEKAYAQIDRMSDAHAEHLERKLLGKEATIYIPLSNCQRVKDFLFILMRALKREDERSVASILHLICYSPSILSYFQGETLEAIQGEFLTLFTHEPNQYPVNRQKTLISSLIESAVDDPEKTLSDVVATWIDAVEPSPRLAAKIIAFFAEISSLERSKLLAKVASRVANKEHMLKILHASCVPAHNYSSPEWYKELEGDDFDTFLLLFNSKEIDSSTTARLFHALMKDEAYAIAICLIASFTKEQVKVLLGALETCSYNVYLDLATIKADTQKMLIAIGTPLSCYLAVRLAKEIPFTLLAKLVDSLTRSPYIETTLSEILRIRWIRNTDMYPFYTKDDAKSRTFIEKLSAFGIYDPQIWSKKIEDTTNEWREAHIRSKQVESPLLPHVLRAQIGTGYPVRMME